MARKKNIRVPVKSSDRFVGTGVHAPLNVQAPVNKFEGIGEALSAALQVGGKAVFVKHQVDAAESRRQQKQAEIVLEAERVKYTARAISDRSEKIQAYQKDFDKNSSVSDLAKWIDDFDSKKYAGATPREAKIFAPSLVKDNAKLMAAHTKLINDQTMLDLQDDQGDILRDLLPRLDTPEGQKEYALWRESSKFLLGTDITSEIAIDALGRYSQETKSEAIYDSPTWEQLRTNQKFQDDFASGRELAVTARETREADSADLFRLAQEQSVIQFRQGVEAYLEQDKVLPMQTVERLRRLTERDAAGKQQLGTTKFLEYMNQSFKNRLEMMKIGAGAIDFTNPDWMAGRGAEEKTKDWQEDFDRQIKVIETDGTLSDTEKWAGITDMTQVSGMLSTRLERKLQAPVSDPQAMKTNAELVRSLAAANVGVARRYAGGEYAKLEAYNGYIRTGSTDAQAADMINKSDFQAPKPRWVDEDIDDFRDFSDFAEGDRNEEQVMRSMIVLATNLRRFGVPRAQAMEQAAELTKNSLELVGDSWVPSSHITNSQALEAGMDWLFPQVVEYNRSVDGLEIDPDDLIIVPKSPGGVWSLDYQVMDAESGEVYPISDRGTEINIQRFQDIWGRQLNDQQEAEDAVRTIKRARDKQVMKDIHVPWFMEQSGMNEEQALEYFEKTWNRQPWGEVSQLLRDGYDAVQAQPRMRQRENTSNIFK